MNYWIEDREDSCFRVDEREMDNVGATEVQYFE